MKEQPLSISINNPPFILFQYRKSVVPEYIWNSTDPSKAFELMLETNSTEIDLKYFDSRKRSEEFYINYAHQMNETILEVSTSVLIPRDWSAPQRAWSSP